MVRPFGSAASDNCAIRIRASRNPVEPDDDAAARQIPVRVGQECGAPFTRFPETTMSLSLIILIVLVLALIGVLPTWGHSRSWGYGPSGGIGLVLLIVIVLVVMGRI
jgi:hypothetical protein